MAVVTPEIQNEVAELYIGFFGRAPDAAGFGYWAQDLANGASPYDVAANFARSPEFVSEYAGLTPAQQVDKIYNNVLGRSPDAEGLAYWTEQLEAGTPTSVVVYQIVYAAFTGSDVSNPDPVLADIAVRDRALVQNKVTVGQYFAIDLASNDTALAATAFNLVTSEPASVAAAEAYLNANGGETYTLTTEINNYTGTPYNDTFNAPLGGANADVNTLNAFDSLDGNGGTDTLNAVLRQSVIPAHLDNIEIINVQADGGTVALGLQNAGQLTTLTNNQSNYDLTVNGIVATATTLAVNNATGATTFNYAAEGPEIANLSVSGMENPVAETITVNGVPTVALTSAGATANSVRVNGDADSVAAGDLSITVSGSTNLTLVSADANSIAATGTAGAGFTGNLTATLSNAGTLTGGTGNDVLTGTAGNDVINGNAGNNTLVGLGGNDTFSAADGNNTVTALGGNDTVTLGNGNNTVAAGDGTNTITTGNGNSTITSGTGVDSITSGSGNDSITAGDGNNIIAAGAGNNTVTAGSGDDSITTLTGNDTITVGAGNNTVVSGSGTDTVTAGTGILSASDDDINLGGDDDRVTFLDGTLDGEDTLNGGTGTADTLVASSNDLEALSATAAENVSNIEVLELSDTLSGTINAFNVGGSVNKVVIGPSGISAGTGALNLNAGASTVEIRNSLTGALAIDAAGVGTDTLALNVLDGSIGSNLLQAKAITTTDFETVTLTMTSAAGGSAIQTVSTLDVGGANALILDGTNGLTTTGAITAASIDASGFDGTAALVMGAAAVSAATITGGANNDTLRGMAATATTISGGDGADSIVGGTAADSLAGGNGNDSITGAGANDTITGGAGDDQIDVAATSGVLTVDAGADNDTVVMGATLTQADTIDGNSGIDTLSITANVTSPDATYVSNFEVLDLGGALTGQDMSEFTNADQINNWTTLNDFSGAVSVAFTAVGDNVTALNTDGSTGTLSLTRAAVGTTSLTVGNVNGSVGAAAEIDTLTVNNEDTVTINGNLTIVTANLNTAAGTLTLNSDDGDLAITTLNASSLLTDIAISGDNSVTITNAIAAATNLSTVTSSLSDGAALRINGSASTTPAFSFTGSSAEAVGTQSVIAGAGADIIIGNNGRLDVLTQNGADSITAGDGADTIDAGGGNDTISAGAGSDTLTGNTGVDTITLVTEEVGTGNDTIYQAVSDSAAATGTSFAGALVAAGDTMTFGNGVDVINGFTAGAGGDVLATVTTLSGSLIGETVANLTASEDVYYASGNYNEVSKVFTITADGTGADTMIISAAAISTASDSLLTNASAVILKGVDSDALVAGNFADAGSTYTVTENTTVDMAADTITGGWTATTLLADGYTDISGDRLAPYTLDVNATVNGNQTYVLSTGAFTSTAVGGDYEVLTYQSVSNFNLGTGNDTYTTNNLTTGTTVSGGAGTDTVVLTSDVAGGTIRLGTGATNIINFENIDASASTASVTANLVDGSTSYVTSAFSDSLNLTGVKLAGTLEVNASAAGDGDTVSVTGNNTSADLVDFSVGATKTTTADVNATGLIASLNLALGDAIDNGITVTTGFSVTTISGSDATDTVTIDADQTIDGQTLTVSGAATTNISVGIGDTGFVGDLVATALTGALQVGLGDASTDSISITTGTNSTTVSGGDETDTVTINAAASDTGDTITIQKSTVGTVPTTQIFNVTNLIADLVNAADGAKYITATLADGGGVAVTALTNNSTTSVVTVRNGDWELTDELTLNGAGAFTVGVAAGQEFKGDVAAVAAGAGVVNFVLGNVNGTQNLTSTRNVNIDVAAYDDAAADTLKLDGAGVKTVTTGTDSFTIDAVAASGAISVNAADLDVAKVITLTDTGTGPNVTITNLDVGDLSAGTYDGNITVTAGADIDDATIAVGAGTNVINFDSANLTNADVITSAGSDTTLNITGDNAIAFDALIGTVDINTVTFANITTNIVVETVDAMFTNSGTFSYSADNLTTGTFNFDGTDDGVGPAQAVYNISVGAGHEGASTVVGGTAGDTISLMGSGNSTVAGAAGADTVSVGSGSITVQLANGDTGANNTTGAFVGTSTFDVYTGLGVGDTLNIFRSTGAAFTTVATSTTNVAGAEATITWTRGVYDAANDIFTANAAGSDSLATYDLDTTASVDLEAIVLVGFVGSSTLGDGALPNAVTLI